MAWFVKAPIAAGVLVAASLLVAQPAAAASALVNGGFESGTSPWTVSPNINLSSLGSAVPTEGAHVGLISFDAFFGEGGGTISQSFSTSDAGMFEYAFDLGRGEGACSCNDVALTFEARIDGVLLSNALPAFDASGGGSPVSTQLLSHYSGSLMLGAGSHELSFAFWRGATGFGRGPYFLLDGVEGRSLATPGPTGPGVPEPTTWALMIAGFGLAGAALRRRRPALA